jgi:endonuclease/exonuclease/phosphatase (EEP) superfamily protein YafD
VLLALYGHRTGRGRYTVLLLVATVLFCTVFSEGPLVLRFRRTSARHAFETAHNQTLASVNPTSPHEKFPLRILSWNLAELPAGADAALEEMAGYQPDLCFVQEVWGGARDLPRAAIDKHFPGFGWLAEPDCGLLSRYPARENKPLDLGARREAFVAEVTLPSSRTVICVNVHPPLYPLQLGIWNWSVRQETQEAVARRAETMRRLATAVESYCARGDVIVAGDWNVPASAASLKPLSAMLRDAFREGGSGWGNSMTNDFPVARIDAIFVSKGFNVVRCAAHRTKTSDHRLVEADVWLLAKE